MMRLSFVALLVLGSRLGTPELSTFHHENVLGTSLEMKIAAADPSLAEAAALAEFDRLSKILSAWDSSSEFSRWTRTRGEAIAVSPELYEVLGQFDHWSAATNGAINAGALAGDVAKINAPHWTLEGGKATHLDDARLVLASFAKSYVTGKAADAALNAGATGVMLNVGGDVVVRGSLTETVSIRDPRADAENDPVLGSLAVRNATVATSGPYRRGSHILDPRTGRPAEDVLSSTVMSPDPNTAGALATAFAVLAPEEVKRVAAGFPATEYLVMRRDGTQLASNAFRNFALLPAAAGTTTSAAGEWNNEYELAIQLSLARVSDPRYRRPYVAVWIEDKDKFPVRTVALWYEKPRWLPELKMWYRDDRMRSLAEGTEIANTVSSATRPPGKYTFKWDGKDNHGKLVKSGRYSVCIEAAREHGSYEVVRQEMDFNGAPKQVQVPGNSEIESASLEYRKTVH